MQPLWGEMNVTDEGDVELEKVGRRLCQFEQADLPNAEIVECQSNVQIHQSIPELFHLISMRHRLFTDFEDDSI